MTRVYLDHNATTPILPEVSSGMSDLLQSMEWGNPSSLHEDGRKARRILEDSRDRVAAALKVDPAEIFFTGGGTESNNLAISGLVADEPDLAAGSTEHPSILEPVRCQHADGRPGSLIPVDPHGRIELEHLPTKGLVSVQWFNNETGIYQDLPAIGEIVHSEGGRLHSDGAQAFFRCPINLGESHLDSASITAHKAGGPPGVGALWIRKGLLHRPSIHGGPQEKKIRPGTENLLAIHGMGLLADSFDQQPRWNPDALVSARSALLDSLEGLPDHRLVDQDSRDWPGCINLAFSGIHAETLLVRLDMAGISASSGSACSSGAREPSHVLKAMGIPEKEIRGSIRISLGPESTPEILQRVGQQLCTIVSELREQTTGQTPVP